MMDDAKKVEKIDNACEYLEDIQVASTTTPARFARDDVLEIMTEMYAEGTIHPREIDIVQRYIKRLETSEGVVYTYREKQATVNKALKSLIKRGKVVCSKEGGTTPRYTILKNLTQKELCEQRIVEEIVFNRREVFVGSISTVIVSVSSNHADAKKLFEEYLGPKRCYGIIESGDFLLILLVGGKEKLKTIRTDIKLVVARAFDHRMAIAKEKNKLKSKSN